MNRLTTITSVLCVLMCSRGTTPARCNGIAATSRGSALLNRRVALRSQNQSLPVVIARMSSQYDLAIVSRQIPANARLTSNFNNIALRDALDELSRAIGSPWQLCGEVIAFADCYRLPWWNLEASQLGLPGAVEEATVVRVDLTSEVMEFLTAWSTDHLAVLFRDGSSIAARDLYPQEMRAVERLAARLGIDFHRNEQATALFKLPEFGQTVGNDVVLRPLMPRPVPTASIVAEQGRLNILLQGEFRLGELAAKLSAALSIHLTTDRRLGASRLSVFLPRAIPTGDFLAALSEATGGEMRLVGTLFHIGLCHIAQPTEGTQANDRTKQNPHRIIFYNAERVQAGLALHRPYQSLLKLGGRLVLTGPSGFKITFVSQSPV